MLTYAFVFILTFVLLFLGMDRGFDFYDEGLNLVGAMRVAAGQVPHRDFYANYGPAQFYTLAWLFDLFGPSVFVERIYDLTLRSAIVTMTWAIAAAYCKRWVVVVTTLVCALWLFSAGLPTIAYPVIPLLLIALIGSALLLPVYRAGIGRMPALLAGCATGLAMLFRYDVGFALALVHLSYFALAPGPKNRPAVPARSPMKSIVLFYTLGAAAIFLPPALLYLSVAPLHPFLHDIILYPAKYYARARRTPFPGIHWKSLENLAVYLPVVIALLCLYSFLTARFRHDDPRSDSHDFADKQDRIGFLTMFGLLGMAFYFKGLVRISVGQMLLSIIPTLLSIAILFDYTARHRPRLHRFVAWTLALSVFTATWSALKEVRVLYLSHQAVLEEVLSPPGPESLRSETAWCGAPSRLHVGLCFLVDPSHIAAISYIAKHSKPSEPIFIGNARHDRLAMNDLLTYFISDRLPATHWAQFDPDLQMRADIQREMIQELQEKNVRYVILESQFDAVIEPFNDSSKSTGVTLLDDYIRHRYQQVETFGAITVWSLRQNEP